MYDFHGVTAAVVAASIPPELEMGLPHDPAIGE
jgi:hypothetical protein